MKFETGAVDPLILLCIVLFLVFPGFVFIVIKKTNNPWLLCLVLLLGWLTAGYYLLAVDWPQYLFYWAGPLLGITTLGVGFWNPGKDTSKRDAFTIRLKHKGGQLTLQNIRRGISVVGSAGCGKTESVLAQLIAQSSRQGLSGVIHDYKDFELTEIAYPLLDTALSDFYCVSFDPICHRVNPIAPRYLPSAEAINEVVHVLVSNLLEYRDEGPSATGKFFGDAVEGLLAGLIWRLRVDYPKYCTLPHLIALYQQLPTTSLVSFLQASPISKGLASAFIQGIASERQTAGVLSTLSNALKKISTQRIFYVLSGDEVPLAINQHGRPVIVSLVNNPQYESAYAPVIATVMHAITKQMAVRGANPSFILLEEAPTIRLHNMHRIPATLRSFDIATIYVMQDKIQNDLMYGEKASKAILSNLSYQFFGKVNDPETAKYYEQFFEIVKKPTKSINRSHTINFDTRITTGEREVSKIRADVFFRLQPGEFISFADGIEKRVQFGKPKLKRQRPEPASSVNLEANFARIHREVRDLFQG